MAVTEKIDQQVPIREGDYGARVGTVEPGGVEYIPEAERHGRPSQLFWTWMSPNMEFATVYVGVLPIAIFGGGFWPTAIGVIIGSLLGSISHAILSAMGPRFGVPQMVESRASFGFFGSFLPAALNWLTASFGWFIVNSVSGAFALQQLFVVAHGPSFPFSLAFIIVVVAQVVIAFIGHNMVHQFEKWIFPFLGIVFGLATIIIMVKTNYALGFNSKAPVAFGGSSGAFILAIFIAYGYAVGWNPFASDYSRYLPKSSNPWRVGLAAGLGVFISCAVLEVAGAGAATIPTLSKIPTAQFTDPLPTVLQVLVLLGIGVGAVAANVLNIYSGAMSFLTLGIKFGLRLRRAISAVVFGAIGLIIGLVLQVNAAPGSNYENFLLVIAYWITPYLAVVIIDFFLRGGQYPESVFYVTSQRTWNGLIAMVAGILASTPFFNQTLTSPPKLWIGWFAYNHPEWGDLSFFVGFAVAALVYLGLYRLTGSQRTVAAAA